MSGIAIGEVAVVRSLLSTGTVVYTGECGIYTGLMTKRLIDVDDDVLAAARVGLGTRTIRDTVNEALRQAAGARRSLIDQALDVLANAEPADRSDAWR